MKISASAAKQKFGLILMKAQKGAVFIEKHGTAVAVVISAEKYEMYQELAELMQKKIFQETNKS